MARHCPILPPRPVRPSIVSCLWGRRTTPTPFIPVALWVALLHVVICFKNGSRSLGFSLRPARRCGWQTGHKRAQDGTCYGACFEPPWLCDVAETLYARAKVHVPLYPVPLLCLPGFDRSCLNRRKRIRNRMDVWAGECFTSLMAEYEVAAGNRRCLGTTAPFLHIRRSPSSLGKV